MDITIGDPKYPLHPVKLMGIVISAMERFFLRIGFFTGFSGVLLIVTLQTAFVGTCWIVGEVLQGYRWVFLLFVTYSLLALKDLIEHAQRVVKHLKEENLPKARRSVAMMVGRDVSQLESSDISRAAIESVAENFTDGVLSPMFWFVVGAAVGSSVGIDPPQTATVALIFFKATNTLDSMVGYRNEKYRRFGKASARLDDALNFFPARIAIFMICLSAFLTGQDGKRAWKIGWRDRLKHRSPNAGHAEASMAGALGVKLGGDTVYAYGTVKKPWMGEGTTDAKAYHLRKACNLVFCAALLSLLLAVAVLLLPWRLGGMFGK